MIEIILAIVAANLDPVFLDQQRNKVATIASSVPLNATNLVKERRQDSGVGVAYTCKVIAFMRLYVLGDQRFAVFLAPLVQPVL